MISRSRIREYIPAGEDMTDQEGVAPTDPKAPERVPCPNCEDLVEVNRNGVHDGAFPCPKCAFMIHVNDRIPHSGTRTLAKVATVVLKDSSEALFSMKGLMKVGVVVFSILALALVKFFSTPALFPPRLEMGVKPSSPSSAPTDRLWGTISNSIGMDLVLVPPGKFLMGSQSGSADEQPVHEISITRPFYIGTREVTVEEYCGLMEEKPFFPMRPTQPILFVSWSKAQAFCRKLSEKENAQYRLPTEAEWEYACRAGTTSEYFWGDQYEDGYAWCHFNSGRPTRTTHDVGTLQPNAWGLYDMCGNVGEWCQDFYSDSYYSSSPKEDPQGPESGSLRVCRGGWYDHMPRGIRSASRDAADPSPDSMAPGFRVVRNP